MDSNNVAVTNPAIEFNEVRRTATGKAGESLPDPVIIAGQDGNSGRFGL